MVRDLDLGDPQAADGRRLEVVMDGLPVWRMPVSCGRHSCECSPLRWVPTQRSREHGWSGLAKSSPQEGANTPRTRGASKKGPPCCPGVEVDGRMSTETTQFLSQLAKARARQETALMGRLAEQARQMRWGAILACATAKAVATSLFSLSTSHGADGNTPPTHEVEGDHRYAGLVS